MVWDGGLDGRYRDTLTRPHLTYTRVDVTDSDGNVLLADIPFMTGQLTATLSARVARTVNFSVTEDLFPVDDFGEIDPFAPLAPYGNRVKITWGVQYGDGSRASFPVFYGRIEKVSLPKDGSVKVSCIDLAGEIADSSFLVPTNSFAANTIDAEWRRLITDALPNATFGISDNAGPTIGQLAWEYDRGRALDDMITAMGQVWYPLANGDFVHVNTPWTEPGRTPVVTLSDASGPAPLLTDYQITVSRTGVANAAVFAAERQDGTLPQFAQAFDLDPASPTFYNGPFGKKPVITQNQAALTQPQCLIAAKTQLNLARSLTQTWDSVKIIPDGSLELGDCVLAQAGRVKSIQVITGFTLPLREDGDMALTLRAYTPLVVV